MTASLGGLFAPIRRGRFRWSGAPEPAVDLGRRRDQPDELVVPHPCQGVDPVLGCVPPARGPVSDGRLTKTSSARSSHPSRGFGARVWPGGVMTTKRSSASGVASRPSRNGLGSGPRTRSTRLPRSSSIGSRSADRRQTSTRGWSAVNEARALARSNPPSTAVVPTTTFPRTAEARSVSSRRPRGGPPRRRGRAGASSTSDSTETRD